MCDWDQNEFMSSWDKTYVSTNVKPNSKKYDCDFFLALNASLVDDLTEMAKIAPAILAVSCCAVGRADLVGRIFDDLSKDATPEESKELFLLIREAITIVYPFLGMPTCIPACYGLIGVIERRGEKYASLKRFREPIMTAQDAARGQELRSEIYSKVGNSAIFDLMDKYFTDLFTSSTSFTWGYLISNTIGEVFTVTESHLIVVCAINALGAVRQSKSHVKASIAIGNSVSIVQRILEVIREIARWAGKELSLPDVVACAQEVQNSAK